MGPHLRRYWHMYAAFALGLGGTLLVRALG